MKVQRFWVQGFKVQGYWVQGFKVQRFWVEGSRVWDFASGFDSTRKVRPSRWLEKGVVKAIK
jgi:hypothetical protein